ncbi:hypothetical protein [Mucilaginibacter sp. 10B2]|uniref:hypothetical protein n=1 Tax=Mucilaginibacter sp. 10B2 TaxID=3048574 RepID=UPI002B228641|nr:hypothetical protein [Mucilaginibacter sp. 10B2]MEB0278972.1 hypothetical protein [Mucilaginibacter sp. 10B2]
MDKIYVLMDNSGYLCDRSLSENARTLNIAHAKQYNSELTAKTIAGIKSLVLFELMAIPINNP